MAPQTNEQEASREDAKEDAAAKTEQTLVSDLYWVTDFDFIRNEIIDFQIKKSGSHIQ